LSWGGSPRSSAARLPPACDLIGHVVGVRSFEEMRRVAAKPEVALVPKVRRVIAVGQFEGDVVRLSDSAVEAERAVATFGPRG
jgi:hypothetical protein